jgi:hypothetical protein
VASITALTNKLGLTPSAEKNNWRYDDQISYFPTQNQT